jgi:hypothetical protein
MHYEAGGAADATTRGRTVPVPAAEGQARRGPSSAMDDLEAFSQAISLQAAARAARYAIRPGSIPNGFGHGESRTNDIQQEDREIEPGERVSLGRALNLVLTFALGVAVYAGIMYVILGTQLRSPLPTPPLPPPGATA